MADFLNKTEAAC